MTRRTIAIAIIAFAYTSAFRLTLYATVVIVGMLVGLEVPLLMRDAQKNFNANPGERPQSQLDEHLRLLELFETRMREGGGAFQPARSSSCAADLSML